MGWLRLRLRALHQGFPGNGYAVAYVAALWPLAAHAPQQHYRALELTVFVVMPALTGLSHFVAPRSAWGGKPYWLLAALWLAAATFGGLSHWPRLDPATPWLSLTRYLLVFAGCLVLGVSSLYGRPAFVRETPRRYDRRSYRIWAALATSFLPCLALGLALMVIPLRLALAPRYPGARVTRLALVQGDSAPFWLWWRPDGRALLGAREVLSRGQVVLISLPRATRTTVLTDGDVANDRPWLPDSSGFYYHKHRDQQRTSVWFSSADGRQQRPILPDARASSGVTCSPDGQHLAYAAHGIVVCDPDGSHPRRLTSSGRSPRWSPDGRHLLFTRASRTGKQERTFSYWVIPTAGGTEAELPYHGLDVPVWLNDHQLIGNASEELLSRGILGEAVTLRVWDIAGKVVKTERFPHVLDLMTNLAPAPDGRHVAFTAFRLTAQSGIYVLDVPTDRLYALPVVGDLANVPTELKWSPDGRRLAYVVSGHGNEEEDFWTLNLVDLPPLR